jgi:hypothetical protein
MSPAVFQLFDLICSYAVIFYLYEIIITWILGSSPRMTMDIKILHLRVLLPQPFHLRIIQNIFLL